MRPLSPADGEGMITKLVLDDIAVIQTTDQRGVVGGKTRVTCLAYVGVHVCALEERAVVERDGFAPDPQWTNAVEAREEAGTAHLERRDGVGLESGRLARSGAGTVRALQFPIDTYGSDSLRKCVARLGHGSRGPDLRESERGIDSIS